jgi:hypothetical protein
MRPMIRWTPLTRVGFAPRRLVPPPQAKHRPFQTESQQESSVSRSSTISTTYLDPVTIRHAWPSGRRNTSDIGVPCRTAEDSTV